MSRGLVTDRLNSAGREILGVGQILAMGLFLSAGSDFAVLMRGSSTRFFLKFLRQFESALGLPFLFFSVG